MMASGEIRLSATTMRQMPVLAQSQELGGATPQGQSSPLAGTSPDDIPEIEVVANRTFGVFNPGWDEFAGLGFLRGIGSTDAQYLGHIRPRHASDGTVPGKSRFLASILSLSTPKDQFDAALDVLFNTYTPYVGATDAGIALEFALPFPVGLDQNSTPTNIWTVILAPAGSGVFNLVTTFPGLPVPGNN
jgi:hypothetical protein